MPNAILGVALYIQLNGDKGFISYRLDRLAAFVYPIEVGSAMLKKCVGIMGWKYGVIAAGLRVDWQGDIG